MAPYSMPLWTILTKWPEPGGPTCPQPLSGPGASVSSAGRSRSTASSSPPTIML